MSEVRNQVNALNQMIINGEIMDAMNRFYADDVVMAENNDPPTVGLAANLEREQQFVDHTTWYGAGLQQVVVDGDTSMSQWDLDFHNTLYGARLRFTQIAVAKWRNGKIIDERFYYNPVAVEVPA